MILHFIRVITTQDTVKISFDNGNSWKEYPVLDDGTKVEDIEFSKKDCSDLANILIGSTAKHTPYASEGMVKYFNLETVDTKYTTPETFKNLLSTLSNNTVDTPYNIKFKGLTASNAIMIEQAYKSTNKKVYINIESTDLRFNNDLFNRSYFMGKDYQKYLTGITLPDDLIYIGANTFNGCINLKEIKIPTMVTDIGRKAFYGCTGLKSVWLPPSLIYIDNDAFGTPTERKKDSLQIVYLGSLTRWNRVELGSGNDYISDNVSYSTNTMTLAEVKDFLKTQASTAEDPVPLDISDFNTEDSLKKLNEAIRETKCYVDLAGLDFSPYKDKFAAMDDDDSSSLFDTDVKNYVVAITVPDGVQTIGKYVFSSYENLNCIIFSDSVTTISEGAFLNCKSLAETTITDKVTTIGYNAFFGCSNIKLSCKYSNSFSSFFTNSGVTRDNVYKIEIPDTLTSIEDYEFENCTNLTSIKLKDTITEIGKGAFKGCSRLRSIQLPKDVTVINEETFADCVALRSAKLPAGLVEIKDNAFYNDICLEAIEWTGENEGVASKSLEAIGSSVFYNTILEKLDLSKSNLTEISESCFENNTAISSIKLPNSIVKLNNKSFCNCSSLDTINLPNNITSVGDYVFYGTDIKKITLPSKLTTIGIGAFKGTKLSNISFPDGLTNIGEECFMESSIESIVFPNSVKYIDANAFNGCENLLRLDLPNGLKELGYYSFANCTNLGDVAIPNTVTGTTPIYHISPNAFDNLDKITVITLPKKVNVIGDGEGENGENKKDIAYIPKNLKSVGWRGFKNFTNIKYLWLPNGLEEIGEDAFYGCENLEEIHIPTSIKKIDFYAFNSCKNLKKVYYSGSEQEWHTLTVGWYKEAVKADDGTILKDGNNVNIEKEGKKLYIKDGNENLVKKAEVYYNDAEVKTTSFTKNYNVDDYNFNRSKSYGEYNFMVDDVKGAISIVAFKDIEEVHTLKTTIYSFGKGAFYNCPKLSLTIEYTDQLSNYFKDSGITSSTLLKISVPAEITELPNSIFKNYLGLQEITFAENTQLKKIGSYAFYGCKNLKSLVVPDTIEDIEDHAFQDCWGLVSIKLNDDTRIIKSSTFEGCKNLVEINYPKELEIIETRAFYGCESLEYITFEKCLRYIGTNAFKNCTNLKLTCYYNSDYSDGSSDWKEKSKYVGTTGISTKNVYHLMIDESVTSISADEFINEALTTGKEPYQYENLYWVDFSAACTSIGERAFAMCSNLTKVTFPADSKLKEIKDDAFVECTSLESFDIPSGVTTIGNEAFGSCESLKEMIFPEGALNLSEGILSGCYSLTKVRLPSKLTYIPDNMFLADNNLSDINIPKGIVTLGSACFMGCTSIKSFNITNIMTSVGYEAFSLCSNIQLTVHYNPQWDYIYSQKGFHQSQVYHINVDDTLTEIPNYKFENFTSVKDVKFNTIGTSKIKNIGIGAFRGCKNLTTLEPPESCLTIQDWAFTDSKLSTIKFPSKIKRIPNGVLQNCSNLKSVVFNTGCKPTVLCDFAFKDCKKLDTITLPDTISSLGKGAFWGCSSLININIPTSSTRIEDSFFHGCSKLSGVTLHNKLSELGNGAFFECTSLSSFSTDGTSIHEVDNSCFEGCTSLASVNLIDIDELGSRAFYNCSSLSSITLPDSLGELRFGTFENCTSLSSFTIPTDVSFIEGNVFANCKNLTISNGSNKNFKTIWEGKGIISADEKTLYACIDYISSIISVPTTVTKVGNGAFKGCNKITTITFPDSVQYIDEFACQNCTGLENVKLTKNIKRIGAGAFENCENIAAFPKSAVWFKGTHEEWANLIISPDGNSYVKNPLRMRYEV